MKSIVLIIILFSVNLSVAVAQNQAGIKNIVIVHGAFADGSGWERFMGF